MGLIPKSDVQTTDSVSGKGKTMREPERVQRRGWNSHQGVRAIVSILSLTAVAIGLTLAASTPAVAQNVVRTEMGGGPGGSLSEHMCGSGRVLVGVRGYAGVLIDNVQAICARVDSNGLVDGRPEGPVFGGDRPINSSVKCPGDSVVKTAFIRENEKDPYVGYITLGCDEPQEKLQWVTLRGTGHLKGYISPVLGYPSLEGFEGKHINCGGESVAVGISVRAGKFLDAFGLICGPRTKILNKRKKPASADSTFKEGRDKTTASLPNVAETPASVPQPTPAPSTGSGSSPSPASTSSASTDINSPTPLGSSELKGNIKEGDPPRFYSFTAGPGEVVFTLDVAGSQPGGGAAYIYLIKPDALDDFLEGFDLFAAASASESLVKTVQFAEQQTIILRVGGNIGGGSYRLRISGATSLN